MLMPRSRAYGVRKNGDVSFVKKYYQRLQFDLDSVCASHGVSWRIDLSEYINNPEKYAKPSLMNVLVTEDGKPKEGHIWKETVQTIIPVIGMLLAGKNVALIGLCQSAKTPSQVLAMLFACGFKTLKEGRACIPVIWTPKGSTYYGQFLSKFDDIWNAIRHAKISIDDKTASLNDIYEETSDEFYNAMSDSLGKVKAIISADRKKHIQQELKNYKGRNTFVLPMSCKNDELFRLAVEAARSCNFSMIIDRDEAHHSVGKNSTNDKMFSPSQSEGRRNKSERSFTELNIYKILNDRTTDFQLMAVSATNWNSLHLDKAIVYVNENYTGIDFAYLDENGLPVRITELMGVTIRRPEIKCYCEMAKEIGDVDLAYIRPHWYQNEDAFLEEMERNGLPFSGWRNYKKRMIFAIANLIDWLLIRENPKNKRGVLLRFVNDNVLMDEFIQQLRKGLDKRIKIVKFYRADYQSVDELLRDNDVGPDDLYVVVPTAGARMGDSFPAHCGYGIDFTYEASTLAALIQGILGRIGCGYFKDPLVILSPANVEIIEDYERNGNYPLPGTKLLNTARTVSNGNAVKFDPLVYKDNPLVAEICERITKHVVRPAEQAGLKKPLGDGIYTLNLGHRFYKTTKCDFINKCITHDDLVKLGEIVSARNTTRNTRLLGFEEVDELGREYERCGSQPILTTRLKDEVVNDKSGGKNKPHLVVRVARGPGGRLRCVAFDLLICHMQNSSISIEEDSVTGKVRAK